jgi:hypothetical protein
MRVDALSVELRPRTMAEAADLGVLLVRRHAASVWLSYLPVHCAVVLLALCTAPIAHWLPALVIFWLKPWLDRSLLFVLSRAVFGQETRWNELWQHSRAVWWGRWPSTLLWRRFSPWRSFTQPIYQLEGQRGRASRQRREQLLRGRRAAGAGMQMVFGNIELALYMGALSIAVWFAPQAEHGQVFDWILNTSTLGNSVVLAILYGAAVLALEPFFVAAGFVMYLNRRVELEAWDIEQEFRRAFAG